MTRVDWIIVAIAVLGALTGLRRGLVATALSLVGLIGGALIGARVAPHLLHGGAGSPYTPLAGLVGALCGAALFQWGAGIAGSFARGGLSVIPPLRVLDSLGGLLAGGVLGLAVVWVAAAVLLLLPGQTRLRTEVQQSKIVRRLNELAPPRTVLRALARVDPFPQIAGPAPPATPPDARVLASASVRHARRSVVRITTVACGLGVEGSGWVAKPHLVVTAAHVVAGERDTVVEVVSGDRLRAVAAAFDSRNDVAVLRVEGLDEPVLRIVRPEIGRAVAVLGYPDNGPFTATPGRIGPTQVRLTQDAYGTGHVFRDLTSLRGRVRHGNSGSPAVDASGAVQTTVFASLIGARGGLGIPSDIVRRALSAAERGGAVSTGGCAP